MIKQLVSLFVNSKAYFTKTCSGILYVDLIGICIYFNYHKYWDTLTLLLQITSCPVLANSVDPDQLASEDLDLHCLSLNV